MGLTVEENWSSHLKKQREKITEEIARQLSRDHPEILRGELSDTVEHLIRQAVVQHPDLAPDEVEEVVAAIKGQVTGYGPLQELFADPDITEIMINPTKDGPRVFYSKHGVKFPVERRIFKDDREVTLFCQRICENAGRPFNADAPIVDAWLKDGSRINVMGFKVSPLGTTATIRKSPLLRPPLPLSALVASGTFPQFVADFMVDVLVKGHANLGVFGRTDSGKTTVLRSLGDYIDPADRTVITETSFELAFPNLPNCINLVEVAYGNETIVDMSMLCRAVNRINPDRMMVGEIRSREVIAASQLAASTSGGFWTTGHAGSVDDLRTRLWGMFLDGGVEIPPNFLDEIIRSMFDFLIFLDKESKTDRRVLMSLVEVTSEGYRTIIRFDEREFLASQKQTYRWIFENPVTDERLSRLAFRGAKVKQEYREVGHRKHFYLEGNE
ncbi:MAG: CpaF family protein [Peptococcaceae bacterium]|nr:CpaF family protein [Peptococcaceae bacterium]